jgi:dTDP-4-amino-4,6-dideoxygalactose transaminase
MATQLQNFPPPRVPLSPLLTPWHLRMGGGTYPGPFLRSHGIANLTSARAAIAIALRHAGIGDGDAVLTPAYHCESMVSAVRWSGAEAVFYDIRPDTAIDLADLERRLSPAVKALLIVHYFGFPQEAEKLRAFCDRHGLLLIEDCAHAIYGTVDGRSLGTFGDYSVASFMKFFPVFDGGCVVSDRLHRGDVDLRSAPLWLSAKGGVNVIERSIAYGRLGLAGRIISAALRLKDLAWRRLKALRRTRPRNSTSPGASEGAYEFDASWVFVQISRISKAVIGMSDHGKIAERRRQNYQKMHDMLTGIPGCRPLQGPVQDGVVPLVLPLYVDSPMTMFPALKSAGVPIWRFGEFLDAEIDDASYPGACELSKHVFQIPCHQSLKDQEMEWLCSTIRRIISDDSQ